MKQNLRTPGPIPVPDWALEAASRQMMNHRGPEFREILTRVTAGLKKAFVTQGDMAVLTSSGTGALEAAVVNVLSPGDKVLAPGLIDTCSNYLEHPELVAQRIERFAGIVGKDRVVASTDCGFGTFAGYGKIDPAIAWKKLAALREGADIADARL